MLLQSIGLILLGGLACGWICSKLRLPALTGMIAFGILIGPYALNLLDPKMLDLSADLRKIALVIILSRAGLSLNFKDLKTAGIPALLLSFLPACFEIAGTAILAPMILGLDWINACLLGSVIAAVSPAVIVPRMLRLMNEKYGTDKAIPQMILAGASLDDIFVIVLFSVFSSMAATGSFEASSLLQIPVSIITGIAVGVLCGVLLGKFYQKASPRPVYASIQFYAIAFLLCALETRINESIPFSSLLAVMSMTMMTARTAKTQAESVLNVSNGMWNCAEVFLFVLVGAEVSISYALKSGLKAVLLLGLVLLFRMAGTWISVSRSSLDQKEKLFCLLAYTPKATVQAAIGAIPLAMGLESGQIILTMAVLAILLTAPIGAWAIDLSYPKLLSHDEKKPLQEQ